MRLMNPFKEFDLDEIPLEIRYDPLTGQTGRVFDLPFKPPDPPDMKALVEKSKEIFCPFCPETIEESTPLFPKDLIPEGRVKVGKATVLPNLLPLDKYIGVCVLSDDHYIPLDGFTVENMKDAFLAAQDFIKRVIDADPKVNYFYVNWNYMPPAGSSMVHPHIQVNCGEVPTNQHRLQLEACRNYEEENGKSFWQDFMQAEKETGERFIGEPSSTFWTLSYVPLSYLPDVWCIFPDHVSFLDISEDVLSEFLMGLSRVLKYFSQQNLYSFNMSLFSVKQGKRFRTNARICPRLLLRAIGNSDHTYFPMIHKEPSTIRPPEAVCGRVREVFRGEE